MATLGVDGDQVASDKTRDRWRWEPADRDDPIGSKPRRLLLAVAQRQRWRAAYEAAKNGDPPLTETALQQLSATGSTEGVAA